MSIINRTLWIGNLEPWMEYKHLVNFLKELNVYPIKIIMKPKNNKKRSAFLEFDSYKTANYILKNFNGIKHRNIFIKLNWVRNPEKNIPNNSNKYTLYVGNLDNSITNDELKNYFQEKYSSILKATVIKDKITNKSKGYGFIEFSNYKEFQRALNNKIPIILKRQKVFVNSGKNKYDEDEEDITIESTTIEHSTSSVSISVINENNLSNSSLNVDISNQNDSFSFLNGDNNKPNITQFFKRKNEEEEKENIKFSEGFKIVGDIYKSLNGKVFQLSQCNYYCNLIFSNIPRNINKDVNLYNGFINLNHFYSPNQLYYKYFSLKPICFTYNKFEGSL